jgi:hypothetical protein
MFPWGDNRRFNSFTGYINRSFGGRIQKLTIDAGFTCPNRDGTVGLGGCTFCNNDSFNPSYCNPNKSVSQQIKEGIEFHAFRYRRVDKFLAYFQAYSNTYAPLETLKKLYEEALSFPQVIGLAIGTRPDCIDSEKLDYLASLAKTHHISVEYGVESCSNETLKQINRGHTFEKSVWAINETAKRGLNVGAHFILGLPGETDAQLIDQVKQINQLPLTTIKFHQLQVVKGTALANDFVKNPDKFSFFTKEEYFDLLVRIIERLSPKIVVERFIGEASLKSLIAPNWGKLRTDQLLILFEKLLEERDTWQGKKHINLAPGNGTPV